MKVTGAAGVDVVVGMVVVVGETVIRVVVTGRVAMVVVVGGTVAMVVVIGMMVAVVFPVSTKMVVRIGVVVGPTIGGVESVTEGARTRC